MVSNKWKLQFKVLISLFSFFLYSFLSIPEEGEKRYFLEPAVSLKPDHIVAHYMPLSDTLASDTLYEVRSSSEIPIYYFRKISTNVCFDNKCRFLRTNVYWNITGRYLGLEFTEDEYLSKTDHVPFTEAEYQEMNQKLADSFSILADYEFENVVVIDSSEVGEVDGVTSATIPAVKDFVVEGAVYTTMKLWHIIHGSTRSTVQELTVENLSEDLVLLLLNSNDAYDLIWVINKLNRSKIWSESVQSAVAEKLDDNYLLTNSILTSLDASLLDANFQKLLFQAFLASEYGIKELIVEKLSEAESLNEEIVLGVTKELPDIQGNLFVKILNLVGRENWQNVEIYRSVAHLLTLPNHFLNRKVYDFLSPLDINDPIVVKAIEEYEKDRKQ